MPTLEVVVSGRARGMWRVKLATWLLGSLRFHYRIGKGKWRDTGKRTVVSVKYD